MVTTEEILLDLTGFLKLYDILQESFEFLKIEF